jgi:choline dehydrogenase-like flavoprotein
LRHPGLGDDGWAARPLDPIDFEVRQGIPHTGWPFDREHLDPYYARAQIASELGPYKYGPDEWSDPTDTPILPLDGTDVENTVFQAGQPTFQRVAQQFRSAPNIRLLLKSRVVGLHADQSNGSVTRVIVRRDDGTHLIVRPRMVVLAAGGIENARLLLCADEMRGLGNEHDVVGRFFAERLSLYAGHVVSARKDVISSAAFYDVHRVGETFVRGALRVTDKVQRDRQLRNCTFFVLVQPAAVTSNAVRSLVTLLKAASRRPLIERPGTHLATVLTGLIDLGALAAGRVARADPVLTIRAQGEQAPNRESRVTLGSHRDDLGIPRAKVTWLIDESDRASIRASLALLDGTLRTNGIGFVEQTIQDGRPFPLLLGNHHHMGATRMHVDPREGVVDADCRVHTTANLYVAGSSVFPTYGCSNPTLTIVALALRLADHLKDRLIRG